MKHARKVHVVITEGKVHAYSSNERMHAILSRLARRIGIKPEGAPPLSYPDLPICHPLNLGAGSTCESHMEWWPESVHGALRRLGLESVNYIPLK